MQTPKQTVVVGFSLQAGRTGTATTRPVHKSKAAIMPLCRTSSKEHGTNRHAKLLNNRSEIQFSIASELLGLEQS
jgi:hypothetical protein